jgi:hypothetical protein
MIKGVNKQVLEINETSNGFFEKAIFFVKPEYSGMSEGKLREKACSEMNGICSLPRAKATRPRSKVNYFLLCSCFLCGVITGILFCTLL